MPQQIGDSQPSRWTRNESYNNIYSRLRSVKEYMDKHEEIVDTLTVREKTFLGWQLRTIYEMIFALSDTEEEEEEKEKQEKEEESVSEEESTFLLPEEGLFMME